MTMPIEPTPTRAGVTKGVIPAGGLGAQFLPATKATPKEMLPVIDKPAIQYVVEEAVAAGCNDLIVVTAPGTRSIEDHFDEVCHVERALVESGDTEHLERVRHLANLAHMHYVRQGRPLGLGHAVLQAAHHVGDEPFVVLLGDDLIDDRDPVLPAMLDVRARYGGSVVALMEACPEAVADHGCAAVHHELEPGVLELAELVEKPPVDEAPSNLVVIGRYVLDPEVFTVLRRTPPGRDGEIQLTDALRTLISLPGEHGGGVRGVVFSGRRRDTGDPLSYLRTVVEVACDRPDLGPRFTAWLREFVGGSGG